VYYSLICSAIFITVIISEYSPFLSDFDEEGNTFTNQNQCIITERVHISLIDIVISIALKSVKFH